MRRGKKIILIAVLSVVVLAGTIGGVAFATDNGDDSQPAAPNATLLDPATANATLLDKVCTIYQENTGTAIDAQELQKAFDQARSEMMTAARDNYLQKLVEEDKLTQEQADQYKTWLDSMPDVPLPFGPEGHGGIKPFGGFRGPGGRFFHGFGGPCAPQTTE